VKNNPIAKTLTASLPHDAQILFARIADPENLPLWHSSFCRSVRKEAGVLLVESPKGPVATRFIRNDHSLVLDILAEVVEGIELTNAIRVLSNGEGSEIVWTLVKPDGVSESIFNEQLRWAGSALHQLRKTTLSAPPEKISPPAQSPEPSRPPEESQGAEIPETTESLQAPSPAEVSSMPTSGKKLFVGNLSYAWTDEELRAHFSELGVVAVAEIARFRGRGGRSRGFGFVEMAGEAEAQSAIEKLHGGTAGGRQIIVRLAKSQESRPPAAAFEPPPPGAAQQPERPQPSRRRAPARSPRQERPPRRIAGTRRPATRSGHSYTEVDIVNKSGYEIFPLRPKGGPGTGPASSGEREPSRIETSPYMEDTGDIENHGNRPPRHRRRR